MKSCIFLLSFSWESDSQSIPGLWIELMVFLLAIISQESLVVMLRIHCETHHGTLSEWSRHYIPCTIWLSMHTNFCKPAYGHWVSDFAFYSGSNKTECPCIMNNVCVLV